MVIYSMFKLNFPNKLFDVFIISVDGCIHSSKFYRVVYD